MLKTIHPEWSYQQLKERIVSTVEPSAALAGKCATGGRLNAANALGYAWSPTKFYVVNDSTFDQSYEYDATHQFITASGLTIGNAVPRGAASTAAGDKVWVVDANRKVFVYNTSGGILGSWTAGSLQSTAQVEGIATNGTDVWIVDNKTDKVYRYAGAASRLSGSQSAAGSFKLASGNTNPKDIVTNGSHLWVVNDGSTDRVFKYTLAGSLVASWTIDAANASPTGITLDPGNPAHLWIVDNGTDRVYEYANAVNQANGSTKAADAVFQLAAGNTNPQGIADPPVPVSRPLGVERVEAISPLFAAHQAQTRDLEAKRRRARDLAFAAEQDLALLAWASDWLSDTNDASNRFVRRGERAARS